MSANPIWIAGYFGPVAGASPVWIAPGDGTVPSAVQSEIVSYYAPVAGATAVWIAGFFAPPPAAIGATPITISGWGGSGGGGGGGSTSVWSAADAAANGMTLSNGGLTVTPSGVVGNQALRGSVSRNTGKLYVEFLNTVDAANSSMMLGLADATFTALNQYLGSNGISVGIQLAGASYVSGGFTATSPAPINHPKANDVIAIAVDFTAGKAWCAANNDWDFNGVADPAAGTNPLITMVAPALGTALFPGMTFYGAGCGVWTLQPTAASQKYAPPSGFSAWDGGVAPPPTSVWSSSDASANAMTLSNGGLTVTTTSGSWGTVRGTNSKTSGKVYVEFLLGGVSNASVMLGVASSGFNVGSYLGNSNYSTGLMIYAYASSYESVGFTNNYKPTSATASSGDVIGMAIDFAAGSIWLSRNGSWSAITERTGDPATGANPMVSFIPATVGALFPGASLQVSGGAWTLQATAASQKYAPPSGFTSWG